MALASLAAADGSAAVFDVQGQVSVAAVDTLVFAEPSVAARGRVAVQALVSEWGVLVVRLEGLDGVQREQQCGRGGRRWECGELAARWLGQRLEGRIVRCRVGGQRREALFMGSEDGGPGVLGWGWSGRCSIDGVDVGRMVVRAGWAVSDDPELGVELAEAQVRRRGLWRVDVASPREWFRRRAAAVRAWEQQDGRGGR